MVSLLPLVLSAIILYFGRKSLKYQIPGIILLFVGVGIGYVLHFRWDSFSIHFYKIDTRNFERSKILFIGDSITAEGIRPRGFITKLESLLQIESETICAKGATSVQIISRLNRYPHKFKPSHIIAQSGINDLINGLTEEETKNAQNKLMENIRSTFPTAIVIFIPIHPFFKEKKIFIPSYRPSSNIQLYSWWENPKKFAQDYLVKDGIHLNAKGHTLLGQNLAHQLTGNI
ncbi:MAG: SGNH/GDSL hydrolase family protein [Opitutae bacterium]|jgi:lysophospholipase L1-like esterase|nr:SGNH/GDSL hydrolase family protein [Opitutae bacterium]